MFRRRSRPKPVPLADWAPANPRIHPAYSRPDDWWKKIACRPRQLTDWPGILAAGYGPPDTGRVLDEWDFEPVLWLARNGHLTAPEIDHIREAAREASPGVGTDREQFSSASVSRDGSKVRLAAAMDAALTGEPDEAPDYGVGRGRHMDAEYPGGGGA
jgi:hypothetical protein